MKFLLNVCFALVSISTLAQKQNYLLIGTYTTGKSEGVYVYKFDGKTGDATYVSSIKSSNPSYLAISPNQKYVYAVNENKPGGVTAYSFDKSNGSLTTINQQPSKGDHPCYITTSSNGKFVLVGNYSSGTLSVYPVKKDNSLDTASQVIAHSGSSANKERQESAHVHATVLSKDNKYLFVPDLGMDKLMIYRFNNATGKLATADQPFASIAAGSGPRHFDFHPNNKYAYLMEELSGTVEAFAYNNGKLKSIQTISSHPKDFTGTKGSADIHVSPDGKFLYCSNRGESNTIAIFKINPATGKLTSIGFQSTMGLTPRNFNFDPGGNFLLVANQNSDNVVVFKRNKQTGLLTDTGKRIEVGNPVCLKWINAESK
ncbi:MAG: lactonase family protein [Sphingobacteriales bacterium]|nr:lactonase family protein [Sphingobacteriales bacterium]MBI3719552.1 lactonase family protein [Sphingobacteriales bacterium]